MDKSLGLSNTTCKMLSVELTSRWQGVCQVPHLALREAGAGVAAGLNVGAHAHACLSVCFLSSRLLCFWGLFNQLRCGARDF